MSPARLLEHFDRLIDTPDAVPRLRRFILDLAVRGKLVEQDPLDEPAGELLKKIGAGEVIAGGRRRKPVSPAVSESETPFQVPAGWMWIRFGSIHSLVRGVTYTKSDVTETQTPDYLPILRANNIGPILNFEDLVFVRKKCVGSDQLLRRGDYMIALSSGSKNLVGKAAFVTADFQGGFGGFCGVIRLASSVLEHFVGVFLSSRLYREAISAGSRGIGINNLKRETLDDILFPLPPLAEQHRIVAKVNELMALCDKLEAAQTKREKRRDRLVAATLHGLNNGDATPTAGTPATFEESARFYFNHLPRLTTRPEHLHQLRQTILNLAVRGKLVPQDPTDEPADELLSRIVILRTKLLTEGYPNENEANNQLRKQRSQVLPAGLAPLPPGWRWATLMQCSALIVDCHNKTAPYSSKGIILLRTTNVRDGKLNLIQPKFVNEQTYTRWSARYRPEAGDILITREAPTGEVCIIPAGMKVCLGQRMMLAKLIPGTIDRKFMLYSLRDPQLMDRVQDKPVGATVQHLRVGGVETLLVALPPLAEQRRIVAKADELMALCDELESRLTIASATRYQASEGILQEALAGGGFALS